MTEPDADAIGPDGTMLLSRLLPLADDYWLSAHCAGASGCHRAAPIGVRAAVALMGSPQATLGGLRRRLRCSRCGGRQIDLQWCPDIRPPWIVERDGPAPETRAGLTS